MGSSGDSGGAGPRKLTMQLHDFGNRKYLLARWFAGNRPPPGVDLLVYDEASGMEQLIAVLLPETLVALARYMASDSERSGGDGQQR